MKKLLAMILGVAGTEMASISDVACPILFIDEPEMSKNMIER